MYYIPIIILQSVIYSSCSSYEKCGSTAPCCSKWGYCGKGDEYCKNGCNPNGSFENRCSDNPKDGPFDPKKPCSECNICPSTSPCCSEFGFCGSSLSHCGVGCKKNASFDKKCLEEEHNDKCTNLWIDFSREKSDLLTYEGPHAYLDGILQLRISRGNTPHPDTGIIMGYGALVRTKMAMGYGTYKVRMSSGTMSGIVTAFTLMSADKDEIDWEWVGKEDFEPQHNYFYKGIEDYTKGGKTPVPFNTHLEVHEYAIEYTEEYIKWAIDGIVFRTVNKIDTLDQTGKYRFPVSKMRLALNLWDGGSGPEGTRQWAGGPVDWNDQEYIRNGGFMHANVESIVFECL